ncbi:MAG: MoaD/ThiS family protein [Pseudomonadota bacterium]
MATLTFYGPLSDIMGRKRVVEIGPHPVSIRSLVARLEDEAPELRAALSRMRVNYARNNAMVSPEEMASEGDDIALLPPFSGG